MEKFFIEKFKQLKNNSDFNEKLKFIHIESICIIFILLSLFICLSFCFSLKQSNSRIVFEFKQ